MLGLERAASALPLFEEAYQIRNAERRDEESIANAAYRLAQALAAIGEHARAVALSAEAEKTYRVLHDQAMLAEIEAFRRAL